jgi:holliday junction DNA helicase RuvA
MIAQLRGAVVHAEMGGVVLDVAGVGYRVRTKSVELLTLGAEISIWTHLAVREDALELYGFRELEDLRFFELLIKVSGVGPKTALGILSLAALPTLKQAIASGDLSYLTKVSGIGRKTAEKIIVELRDRVEGSGDESLAGVGDALEALVALGYSRRETQEVLRKFDQRDLSVEDIVRKALVELSGYSK